MLPAFPSSLVSQMTFAPPIWPFPSSIGPTPSAVMTHPTIPILRWGLVLVAVRRSAAGFPGMPFRQLSNIHSNALRLIEGQHLADPQLLGFINRLHLIGWKRIREVIDIDYFPISPRIDNLPALRCEYVSWLTGV